MSSDEETARTLSQIAAILKVAVRCARRASRRDREGPDDQGDPRGNGQLDHGRALQDAAMKKGAASERTVARRLPELVGRDILERRQVGANVEYRSTGLI